jgi:predicted nucleic acid-binding protein
LWGAPTDALRVIREDFLRQFAVIELDEAVAREAITLRQKYKLKLPDAIIWASARRNDALLITRNARDFDRGEPGIRIPYRL